MGSEKRAKKQGGKVRGKGEGKKRGATTELSEITSCGYNNTKLIYKEYLTTGTESLGWLNRGGTASMPFLSRVR